MKKLSIITVCYNEPDLEKTCESIVNQSWQDFEWIVVDGGSNEETQKVWERYKYRIDKFISEPDTGVYNAMNKGIKIATGEYLNFLNAGDYYFYNNVLRDIFINNSYSEDVLYGHGCCVYDNILDCYISAMPEKLTKEFLISSTLRHQASFIRKEIFNRFGLYNEQLKIVSDYEQWIIFFKNNARFRMLPYIISNNNMDGISSNEKYAQTHKKERSEILRKYFTLEEIEQANPTPHKIEYSFLEQLFSVKNHNDKRYKIITILGIHIKIKRESR